MAYYYAAGRYANLLERALSITMSPAADSLFPSTNLWDARASRPSKHGSNGANPSITWDGAAFTPGTGSSYTFAVRAGERRRVTSSGTSNVTVRNLSTLKYLTSGGAWQTASTFCLTAAGALNYTVESLTLCQSPTVNLTVSQSGAVTLSDWPQWNAAVLYGHNVDVGLTVELRSSTDNFSGSNVLEVTGAIKQPAFYMIDTGGVTNRYGRVLFTGTNSATPWYGEVFPCWLETSVSMHAAAGYEIKYAEPQIRNEGRWGVVNVYNLAPYPPRNLKLSFRPGTAGATELRQELEWRSRGGAYPMVIAPLTTETDVFYGRLSNSWFDRRIFTSVWETDLILAEDPVAVPLA